MPRPLDESHPFITFEFDPRTIDDRTWLLIGEAMTRCDDLARSPLRPERAAAMMSVYLARGVQATTAIEGNTLSQAEVLQVVEKGTAGVGESRRYLEREVQNVLGLIREIDHALGQGVRLPISVERLCDLNRGVLDGIPDKPEVVPGRPRTHDVTAGRYLAPHYPEVPALLSSYVKWIDELRSTVDSEAPIEDRFFAALLTAIVAHLYMAWVHPFGNGNGRVARLVEVQVLSESGIVPLVATNLLSDHYNKTRDAYYLALDAARHDVGAFVKYAVRGFVDELRDAGAEVRAQNVDVHWESYVYGLFNGMPSTEARSRQRALALAMPSDRFVTLEQATELTNALAKKYAQCGERTPARDMNDLVKMGLVHRGSRARTFAASRDKIQALIPPVWRG